MQYFSLNQNADQVSFEQAVIQGLAPDKGLYFPENIPVLNKEFFDNIEKLSPQEIAFQVISPYVGNEIPEKELKQIIQETLCFDFPLVPLTNNIYSLELFQGPTMAFKDVGARFMSRCLGYFNQSNPDAQNTVLVATSGDTGGAVASGFLGVKGVQVVILYPYKKVSEIQEKQLTTLGQNIKAIAVHGTFDDCQDMVKKAFLDEELKQVCLTSANSINIARWLPQMFYFFFAYQKLKAQNKPLYISCPSGNFGNICAGVLAKQMGLPIAGFVASTNANNTVPRYLKTGNYNPNPTIATRSNAMDVSNPSNFVRLLHIYKQDYKQFENDFWSFEYSDEETVNALHEIFDNYKYIADPHGAIGYLGLKEVLKDKDNAIGVFLETAHPIKFLDQVEPILNIKMEIPTQIESVLNKEGVHEEISNYEALKQYLVALRFSSASL